MNGKLAMPAGAALVAALVGAGPVSVAQAADAPVSVPCAVSALDTAISSATSGETLSLAARCVYVLTGALPVVSQTFAIEGHGATLKRSYAPGTAAFTILTVDGGVLSLDKLNFRNGNGAISVGNEGQLIVNGGVFTRNTAVDGGAIHNVSPLAPR